MDAYTNCPFFLLGFGQSEIDYSIFFCSFSGWLSGEALLVEVQVQDHCFADCVLSGDFLSHCSALHISESLKLKAPISAFCCLFLT